MWVGTDLDTTGRPAQFGRRIMNEVGDRIVRPHAARLEALLREPEASLAAGPAASEASGRRRCPCCFARQPNRRRSWRRSC
ncbi:hypothetical protein [Streptomyces sp. NPDC001315]|uniref:hypothetical protein n=1 Tax=Streptomyces sp. NPDC001315 TaxID=3364562 RepID=UPI0036CC33CB